MNQLFCVNVEPLLSKGLPGHKQLSKEQITAVMGVPNDMQRDVKGIGAMVHTKE